MANVSGLIEEFLHVQGTEFVQSIFDQPQVRDLVTNYPAIDGTLHLPTADIEKSLLLGYDGSDTAEDDVITLSEVEMSTIMHKLVLEVDLGDDTMRGYKNFLKINKMSAEDMSVVQYFINDAQVREKMGAEIDAAAFRGIATSLRTDAKPMIETLNGFRRMLKVGATANKVKVVTTGSINKTNAVDKLETMYAEVPSALQSIGMAIIVSFRTYNAFRSNYHTVFNNAATEDFINKSTYKGTAFHLGAGKTFVIPFAGMGDDDSVIMTPLANLAYLYDVDSAAKTLDIQKIGFKHKILARLPIGFGIRKLSQMLCIVNDRLIATS